MTRVHDAMRGLAAAAVLAVVAAAALFVEQAFAWQRIQRHAEDAALKGAQAIAAGGDVEQAVRARLKLRGLLRGGDAVAIEWPPPTGRFAGDRRVVRVGLSTQWRSRLLPALLRRRLHIRAAAAAVPPALAGGSPAFLRVE